MVWLVLKGRQGLHSYCHLFVDKNTITTTAKKKSISPTHNLALLTNFCFFPYTAEKHDIYDMNGKLLGAGFQFPLVLIEELQRLTATLHAATKSHYHNADKRGFAKACHYIAWCDSAVSLYMSANYVYQQPHSKNYIEANKPVWERISNQIRFLDPDMYLKMSVPSRMFSAIVKSLCVAYHGLCLNQEVQAANGLGLHHDGKGDIKVFNAVVPCGDFSGGDLLL
jgi:hypothetical protein